MVRGLHEIAGVAMISVDNTKKPFIRKGRVTTGVAE